MRLVVQRVSEASVVVDGEVVGKIGKGALVLLGIHKSDQPQDTTWFVNKLLNLRFFEDEGGKMNLSLKDVGGQVLVVSQFTLYGNCQNGRRPDFFEAAPGAAAEAIYEKFAAEVAGELGQVAQGRFGAMMQVALVNDGPVTLIVEKESIKK